MLDIGTLLLTAAVLSGAAAIVLWVTLLTRRPYPGFRCWAIALTAQTTGAVLFLLPVPERGAGLLLLLRSGLLVLGFLFLLRGMRMFRGRPASAAKEALLMFSFVAAFGYYCLDPSGLDARVVLYSLYSGGLVLAVLHTVSTHRPRYFGSADVMLAVGLAVFVLLSTARAAAHLAVPSQSQELLASFDAGVYVALAQILTALLFPLTLIAINAQRIEFEYEEAHEALRERASQQEALNAIYRATENPHRPLPEMLGDVATRLQAGMRHARSVAASVELAGSVHGSPPSQGATVRMSASLGGEGSLPDRVTVALLPGVGGAPARSFDGAERDFLNATARHLTDVLDRRRSEEQVRRAREFAERLVETAGVMVIGIDEAGGVRIFNGEAERLCGYTRTEVLGRDWCATVFVGDCDDSDAAAFRRALVAGAAEGSWENNVRTRGGDRRRILWWTRLVTDPDGKRIALCLGVDVTVQREAERELARHRESLERRVAERTAELTATSESMRRTGERLQAILDTASSGIILVRERRVEEHNRRAVELFGYAPEEFPGMPTQQLFADPREWEAEGERIYGRIATGEIIRGEILARRRDGSTFWLSMSTRAVDPADPGKGIVVVGDDTTAMRATLEQLREARAVAEQATRAKAAFL
ncbi:MAG: PAS domain S-box protein, partial [Rhodocyclaceae bacterium]|nr:PAS domain S-box protein [Rhodocyclaceae bacterium]